MEKAKIRVKSATKSVESSAVKSPGRKTSQTIGIDLGGTKVAAALVDASGAMLVETRRPTVPPWMAELDTRVARAKSASQVRKHIAYVVEAMADAVVECAAQARSLVGVGLASAGPMDVDEGVLYKPSNFTGWKTVPLVQLLTDELRRRKLRTQVYFQNDAIAAALGEGWVGSASGCNTYAMITVGTGIGSGVIFNGRPAQSGGMGSEWGHMMVHASGISGDEENFYERTVEGLASGTGLIRRAKFRGFKGESAADLARAAKNGDELAREIFLGGSEALAALMFSLSLGFHPEKFVVSGGMLAIKEHFLPQATALYRDLMKRKAPTFLAPVQIAKLGTKAGVIGAARLPLLAESAKSKQA